MPNGMLSGHYKYIVFDHPLKEETGKIYKDLCHKLRGLTNSFPEAEWVAQHHACPPIWYGYDGADLPIDQLRKKLIG